MRCEKRKCEDRLTGTGWSHTEGMENTEAWRFLKDSNCLSCSHVYLPLDLASHDSDPNVNQSVISCLFPHEENKNK